MNKAKNINIKKRNIKLWIVRKGLSLNNVIPLSDMPLEDILRIEDEIMIARLRAESELSKTEKELEEYLNW